MKKTLIDLLAIVAVVGLMNCGEPPADVTKTTEALAGTCDANGTNCYYVNNGTPYRLDDPIDNFTGENFVHTTSNNGWQYFTNVSNINPVPGVPPAGQINGTQNMWIECAAGSGQCGNVQGKQWNLHIDSNGQSHGMVCNVPMFYYESYFSVPPSPAQHSCSPGTQLACAMAGNQGYWFNGAPVSCTSWKRVTVSSGGHLVQQWQQFQATFAYAHLYVFESANLFQGLYRHPMLDVSINWEDSSAASPYRRDHWPYFVSNN